MNLGVFYYDIMDIREIACSWDWTVIWYNLAYPNLVSFELNWIDLGLIVSWLNLYPIHHQLIYSRTTKHQLEST